MYPVKIGEVNQRLIEFAVNVEIAVRQRNAEEVQALWVELQDLRETIAAIEPPPQLVLTAVDKLIADIELAGEICLSVTAGRLPLPPFLMVHQPWRILAGGVSYLQF